MVKPNDYNYVYNYFKERDCKLISLTYKNNITPLDYVAKCGHKETIKFIKFISYDRKLCKKCTKENYKKKVSENMQQPTYNRLRNIIKSKLENSLKLKNDFDPLVINNTIKCNVCKEEKRIYNYSNNRSKYGKSKICRYCCNEKTKEKRKNMSKEQLIIELLKGCVSNSQNRERKGRIECGKYTINKCDIYTLIEKQNNKCIYSGVELVWEYKHPNKPSIDRIDNSKGYILNNIQLVTKRINKIRGDLEHQEFLNIIKDIYKNNFIYNN